MGVTMNAVAQGIIDNALADTKAWLRIETAFDDAAIAALLRSAIDMAEDFCAQTMFARAGVETIAATSAWTRLRVCPVRAIAADWASLPDALRQGIVRLAAHLFAERAGEGPPPAIVTALWRPWRRMRMA